MRKTRYTVTLAALIFGAAAVATPSLAQTASPGMTSPGMNSSSQMNEPRQSTDQLKPRNGTTGYFDPRHTPKDQINRGQVQAQPGLRSGAADNPTSK